jgi:hypothetical protein
METLQNMSEEEVLAALSSGNSSGEEG